MQGIDIENIVRKAVIEFIATGEPERCELRMAVKRIQALETELERSQSRIRALETDLERSRWTVTALDRDLARYAGLVGQLTAALDQVKADGGRI
jgi:predicted RNase H-like nuclease (RuvC/YqgF family)